MKAEHAAGTAPVGGRKRYESEEERQKREKKARDQERARRAAEPVTPEEQVMVGRLLGVVWGFAGPFIRCRALSTAQELQLGNAAVPVIRKYAPFLDDWAVEITLVMTVGALYQATRYTEEDHAKAIDDGAISEANPLGNSTPGSVGEGARS